MGDCCWLSMRVLPSQKKRWIEEFDFTDEEFNIEDGYLTLETHDANYAWGDMRNEAAKAGLVFSGEHSTGGDYDAYAFCAVGGKEYVVSTSAHAGVSVPCPKGGPLEKDLALVAEYWNMLEGIDGIMEKESE